MQNNCCACCEKESDNLKYDTITGDLIKMCPQCIEDEENRILAEMKDENGGWIYED